MFCSEVEYYDNCTIFFLKFLCLIYVFPVHFSGSTLQQVHQCNLHHLNYQSVRRLQCHPLPSISHLSHILLHNSLFHHKWIPCMPLIIRATNNQCHPTKALRDTWIHMGHIQAIPVKASLVTPVINHQ